MPCFAPRLRIFRATLRAVLQSVSSARTVTDHLLLRTDGDQLEIVDVGDPRAPTALASLDEAVGLDPRFAEAFNNLGVLVRERGALDEATPILERAVVPASVGRDGLGRPVEQEGGGHAGGAPGGGEGPERPVSEPEDDLPF